MTLRDTDPPVKADPPPPLDDRHREELHASGLTDKTIEAAGLYSAADGVIRQILGWKNSQESINRGMVIPFLGTDPPYARVKLDFPRRDEREKPIKYESPRGVPNRAYFPPNWSEVSRGGTLCVTEGEKKCLSVSQLGIPCIGLVGVWSWQRRRQKSDTGRAFGRRELIPDLQAIAWKNREVVIAFDSDAATNDLVRMAEAKLTECLEKLGAVVRVARIPSNGDAKVGCDDFIVAHGPDAFRRILAEAGAAETPPPPTAMDWCRMFLAEFFTTADGVSLRWHLEEFYASTGRHYRVVPDSELKGMVLQFLDDRGMNATPRLANDILVCLASEVRVPFDVELPVMVTTDGYERRDLVAMSNGLIDLNVVLTGDTRMAPHTPNWFSTFALPFAFDPTATCDTFLTTAAEIFSDDEECVDLLGEFFGYCLTQETKYHAILLLEGPKRSGKSTLLRVLHALVGDANVVTPRMSTLAEPFGLQSFLGKKLAVVSDAHLGHGDKALSVLETIKSISGEDAVEVHRKFLPSLMVRLRTRFALGCNELPRFGDNANALDSRLLILPTRNTFEGREDRDLEPKLLAELPGVLNFALDGLRRLREQKRFTDPTVSREIRADFARLVNPTRGFLEDRCVVAPTATADRDGLYAAWKSWCEETGHAACSRDVLGTRLRVLVPHLDETRPRQDDGTRGRRYVGVGLRSEVNVS